MLKQLVASNSTSFVSWLRTVLIDSSTINCCILILSDNLRKKLLLLFQITLSVQLYVDVLIYSIPCFNTLNAVKIRINNLKITHNLY